MLRNIEFTSMELGPESQNADCRLYTGLHECHRIQALEDDR
jgi:hypothetical protein